MNIERSKCLDPQALDTYRSIDQLRKQHGVDDPKMQLISQHGWGVYFYIQQRAAEAIPHFEKVLQLQRAQPSASLFMMDGVRISLGNCYIYVNRMAEAEHLFRDFVEELKQRRNPKPSELMLASAIGMHGQALLFQHQYQAAEPLIEQSYQTTLAALGASHPLTLDGLNLRCNMYGLTKQLEKSLQCVQESYKLTRASRGADHWFTLNMLVGVGQAQYALGRYAAAARSLESVHTGLAQAVGVDNPTAQYADYYFARTLLQLHQTDRAALSQQRLDAKAIEGSEPGAPWTLRLQLLRGLLLLKQGKRSEALPLLKLAAELHDDADPTDTIVQEAQHALRKASLVNGDQHLAEVLNDPRRNAAR